MPFSAGALQPGHLAHGVDVAHTHVLPHGELVTHLVLLHFERIFNRFSTISKPFWHSFEGSARRKVLEDGAAAGASRLPAPIPS